MAKKKKATTAKRRNAYFPCRLVQHDDSWSIILSEFHYFDDYFDGKDVEGYTIERLGKKLLRDHKIQGIKFDSEASMFCAYATDPAPLLALCKLFAAITGDEKTHQTPKPPQPKMSHKAAKKLLLKGFMASLDKRAQADYLKNVPYPRLSKSQAELMRLVQEGTDAEKLKAARKINSEARSRFRAVDHYMSHPETITRLLACCDAARKNVSVFRELIWALVFICDRHLPDKRTAPYFMSCLANNDAQTRILGLWGLRNIGELTDEAIETLLADRSKRVREEAAKCADWAGYERDFEWWTEEEL